MRIWWERQWSQPSRGNPLWDDVPQLEHLKSMLELRVADGVIPLFVDGKLFLTEDEKQGILAEEVQPGLMKLITTGDLDAILGGATGDPWFDHISRQIEEGTDDFENPFTAD